MAGISAEAAKAINRRVFAVSRHLIPEPNHAHGVGMSACSSGFDDTYHRVHGAVPTHIPPWKAAMDDYGKDFVDIIYEKAAGEGIAKVSSVHQQKLQFFKLRSLSHILCIDLYIFRLRSIGRIGEMLLGLKRWRKWCVLSMMPEMITLSESSSSPGR